MMNENSNANEGGEEDEEQIQRMDVQHQEEGASVAQPQHQDIEGVLIYEEVHNADDSNSSGRADRRREYRRRMTLDPLADLLVDGVFSDDENSVQNNEAGGRQNQEGQAEGIHLDIDAALPDNNNRRNFNVNGNDGNENLSELELLGELLGRYARSGDDNGSASSDNGEDGNNANERSSSGNLEPPQPARNHSYLPTAQPLYPEEWIPAGHYRHRSRDSDASFLDELVDEDFDTGSKANTEGAETEVVGGRDEISNNGTDTEMHSPSYYSIPEPPTMLHSHSNEYNIPGEGTAAIEGIGITHLTTLAIMEIEDVVLFPGSIIPLRLRERKWVNYLGELIDDARGLYGSHQGIVGRCPAGGMGEVRIVILPRVGAGTRRTRRRPRDRPREGGAGGRTGRWRVDLIRRGATGTRRPTSRRTRRRSDRLEGIETDTLDNSGRNGNDDSTSMDTGEDGDGRQLQNQASESEESEEEFFRPAVAPTTPDDPLKDRIGTMGTITFTHEETASSGGPGEGANNIANGGVQSPGHTQRPSSMVWRERGAELVVTILGTSRVRLIRSVKDEKSAKDRHTQIPMYDVEEIHDGSASLPPSWMLRPPGDARGPITTLTANADQSLVNSDEEGEEPDAVIDDTGDHQARHAVHGGSYANAIQNLSVRSAIPAMAYHAVSPWRLCEKICNILQETDAFQGLNNILHSAAGLRFADENNEHDGNLMGSVSSSEHTEAAPPSQFQVVDPAAFGNWISSNMPLSQNDRLDLLEMVCTMQQLKYILQKLEEKRQETVLRCKHCGAVISQMRHVFSVGGSEGTTGAYVNEHGVVHQTVTLRKVDNHSVVCIGRPETRDSWFPGYSWTIAYCSICSDHLGWKFRSVNGSDDCDMDRPRAFWGFSSITTDNHVTPRRVSFHTRRALAALLQQG